MNNIFANKITGRFLALAITFASLGIAQDLIPPSAPSGLTATLASCGQVNLSWNASVDNTGGSGMKAYLVNRSDGVQTAIGSSRTTFSDTNYVKSSTALTYSIVAQDNAGNRSSASNLVSVTTPACSLASGETVVDGASIEPLGKSMAVHGSRTAIIYAKQNAQGTLDAWLRIQDASTGQISSFLLHTNPGYRQIESDYVLTSATELWTLSFDPWGYGKVLVNQYQLNGSTFPTSATLLSSKSLGDAQSCAKSMILLKSGALVIAWNQDSAIQSDGSLVSGFAYRSPTGNWTVRFPIAIAKTDTNNPRVQLSLAQHPADGSVWAFSKRDMSYDLIALHFTEASGTISLDWTNPSYISSAVDGNSNGPQGEFPFLSAVADPFRNAILLAYQTNQYQYVFVDSLLNDMNSIFLKEATVTIAQIGANGTKSFIPMPNYVERGLQFGFSALSDGSLWLAYQPINHQTLIWNEVYASKYSSGTWSAPVLVGYNYNNYNVASAQRDPGLLIYRTDQPQAAFLTPDQQLHSFMLTNLASPPSSSDTTPPTTSITSPSNGATLTGLVSVSAAASDNVGVARVDFLIDGIVKGSSNTAPYTFSWDTSTTGNGNHTLQTVAYDTSANAGASSMLSESVANTVADTTPPAVAISSPANGAVVQRNTTVVITATATDNVGVTKVNFYVNNTLTGTGTSAPFNQSWTVPAKNNASYTLKAVAYDAAGNTASSTVSVTAK